jgi:hypothetical protein
MFIQIDNNLDLFGILRGCCEENSICVGFCDELQADGEINEEKVKILKIDAYYSSMRMHNPPPSIDCLIIVKDGSDLYKIYLVELRDVNGMGLIRPDDIVRKFSTVTNRFLSQDFASIFMDERFNIREFKMWLITDPFKPLNLTEEQFRKKVKGTVLEKYQTMKPLRFRDKVAQIEVKKPGEKICCA